MRAPDTTPLETIARHVYEGQERITKQRVLIAELERDHHPGLLPAAKALLAQMEAAQALLNEHLQRARHQADRSR